MILHRSTHESFIYTGHLPGLIFSLYIEISKLWPDTLKEDIFPYKIFINICIIVITCEWPLGFKVQLIKRVYPIISTQVDMEMKSVNIYVPLPLDCQLRASNFYTPVFRRDVLWYSNFCPSGSPSVRPSHFSALFSYMLWDIDLKFVVSLNFNARKIRFECHQFPSLFAGVMPLLNFKFLKICSFPHFSPTCFDIMS